MRSKVLNAFKRSPLLNLYNKKIAKRKKRDFFFLNATKLSHNKENRQTLSSSSSPPFNSSVHPALFAFVWFCVCASVRMVSAACCLLLFLII